MSGARTLWTGFAEEVDAIFEKEAGRIDAGVKGGGGAINRLRSMLSGKSPAAPVRKAIEVPAANVPLGDVSRGADEVMAGLASKQTQRGKTQAAQNRLRGEARPVPAAPGAKEAPVDLNDLGAVNRWIAERQAKITASGAARVGSAGPARSYVDASRTRFPTGYEPPPAGPYGKVTTFTDPKGERATALMSAKLPKKKLSPEQLDNLKTDEAIRRRGGTPPVRDSGEVIPLPSMFVKNNAAQRVCWTGFGEELDKMAARRHFLPDGREVDLDLLEPLLEGRSIDTATDEEIAQAAPRPGMMPRLGSWFRSRIPFLFDEE